MKNILALLFLLCAAPVLAHLTPIVPSTCALTVTLAAPDAGVTATVDAPQPTDLVRVSYEPDASPMRSRLQVCPADPADPAGRCALTSVPRPFTAGGQSGTLALPPTFDVRMFATGDLDADAVPVTIALGGTPVVVPFDLRTGFVLVGDTPALGSPVDANGVVTLVGAGTSASLPAPLGGAPLELGIACTLAPPPDLDQFALAPLLDKVRGKLRGAQAKLTIMLDSDLSLVPTPTAPTIVRLTAGSATLLEAVAPMQAGPRGRYASADGSVTIVPVHRKSERVQKVLLRAPQAAGAVLATGDGDLALSAGGLMARRGVALKANGRGTKAGVRER